MEYGDDPMKYLKTHLHHVGGNPAISEDDLENVINWITQKCPVRSGSKYDKLCQYGNTTQLFEDYKKVRLLNSGLPNISESQFRAIRNTLYIRIIKYDWCSICPICNPTIYPKNQNDEDSDDLNNDEDYNEILEKHLETKESQETSYHDNINNFKFSSINSRFYINLHQLELSYQSATFYL